MKASFKGRFLLLLIALLGLILLKPIIGEFVHLQILLDIFIAIIFQLYLCGQQNKLKGYHNYYFGTANAYLHVGSRYDQLF